MVPKSLIALSTIFFSLSLFIIQDILTPIPAYYQNEQRKTSTRQPASLTSQWIQKAALPAINKEPQAFTTYLNCHDTFIKIPTNTTMVRFKLAPCFSQKTHITNENNGFTATLFKVGGKHLTSDFITIAKSHNSLKLTLPSKEYEIPILFF